jgi:hypothetical protein
MSKGSNGIVSEIVVGIIAIILFVVILGAVTYIAKRDMNDGLDEWRDSKGVHLTEVIYFGQKYYCDNAEIPAGQPHKLILYRGENSWLMLPEKNAVINLPIDE